VHQLLGKLGLQARVIPACCTGGPHCNSLTTTREADPSVRVCRSAHEVLRGDAKLLAPEETPEEVIRERQQRAAALAAVQDKLKGAGAAGGVLGLLQCPA
jgi:hypothetical protein